MREPRRRIHARLHRGGDESGGHTLARRVAQQEAHTRAPALRTRCTRRTRDRKHVVEVAADAARRQ